MVAVIGAVQSVVEDAYEVVVLVLGTRGAFAEILHPVLLSDPPTLAQANPFHRKHDASSWSQVRTSEKSSTG
jgi:hypothetical protein